MLKHHSIIRRSAVLLAAVTAVLFAAAAAAQAAPSTIGVSDGMSGEYVTNLGQVYTGLQATYDLLPAATKIGVTSSLTNPAGAIGGQLCNQDNGQAAEIGTVFTGGATGFEVAYALGVLPSDPGGNPCAGDGILNNGSVLHVVLTNLSVGDSVRVYEQEYKNGITFAASAYRNNGQLIGTFDRFVGFPKTPGFWTRCWRGTGKHRHLIRHCIWHPAKASHPFYDNTGIGAINGGALGAGAPTTDLADYAGAQAQVHNHWFSINPNYGGLQYVDSGAGGTSPWLVAVEGGSSGDGTANCNQSSGDSASAQLQAWNTQNGTSLNTTNLPAQENSPQTGGRFTICDATAAGNI